MITLYRHASYREIWSKQNMREVTEQQAYREYDEFLNEVYGDVTILGIAYSQSLVAKTVDPIAYRVNFRDWCDSEDVEVL